MSQGEVACVALGANLGPAAQTLAHALRDLAALPQTQWLQASSLYRSAPLAASGPDFINAVALLRTTLSPSELLLALQALEQQAGRERPYHHAPRTLDLDLIFQADHRCHTPTLTLPHPRWRERAFVVVPLAEIAPHYVTEAMRAAVAHQAIERIV